MNLKDVFQICCDICDKHIEKSPKACIRYGDDLIKYTDLRAELETIKDWCYPMETKELRKCIFCRNCTHYKPYTHIQGGSKVTVYRCDLDNLPKQPNHYCGYGIEKGGK